MSAKVFTAEVDVDLSEWTVIELVAELKERGEDDITQITYLEKDWWENLYNAYQRGDDITVNEMLRGAFDMVLGRIASGAAKNDDEGYIHTQSLKHETPPG